MSFIPITKLIVTYFSEEMGVFDPASSLVTLYSVTVVIVSPDESRGYLGFSTVTPPQRFPFGRDNLKNILVRTFKFGIWVYMGNATNAYFVILTFNLKVTGGHLKVRFWPFLHILAQFSKTES